MGSSQAQESLSLGPEPQRTDPVSGLESKHGRVLSLKESALKLPSFGANRAARGCSFPHLTSLPPGRPHRPLTCTHMCQEPKHTFSVGMSF